MTQELARKVLAELEAMGCSPGELELHRQELFAQFRAAAERRNDRCGDPDDFLTSEGESAETPPGYDPEEWEALCQKWDEELDWVQAVESAEPPGYVAKELTLEEAKQILERCGLEASDEEAIALASHLYTYQRDF